MNSWNKQKKAFVVFTYISFMGVLFGSFMFYGVFIKVVKKTYTVLRATLLHGRGRAPCITYNCMPLLLTA